MLLKNLNQSKFEVLIAVFIVLTVMTGCGGSSGAGDITSTIGKTQSTIIPESVKVEKSGDDVKVNYQTVVPIKSGSVVTSGLTFNNVPLWSNFHETTTNDGLNHTVTIKGNAAKAFFMIYNNSSDKYDNNGKGIKID